MASAASETMYHHLPPIIKLYRQPSKYRNIIMLGDADINNEMSHAWSLINIFLEASGRPDALARDTALALMKAAGNEHCRPLSAYHQ